MELVMAKSFGRRNASPVVRCLGFVIRTRAGILSSFPAASRVTKVVCPHCKLQTNSRLRVDRSKCRHSSEAGPSMNQSARTAHGCLKLRIGSRERTPRLSSIFGDNRDSTPKRRWNIEPGLADDLRKVLEKKCWIFPLRTWNDDAGRPHAVVRSIDGLNAP